MSSISTNLSSLPNHDTEFNAFNKIDYLESVNNGITTEAHFTYGPNRNRTVMEVEHNSNFAYAKYYAGKLYEENEDDNGDITSTSFIYIQGNLLGMYREDQANGSEDFYYAHTDYLGSIIALSDNAGDIVEEYAYDAWGNRRDPNDWSQPDTRTSFICDRGFTGHEHIDEANIINMNGRVYDPLVGMFLSPDPVLQNPTDALNYNRYSYVLNNPLKYTDPSGYQLVQSYTVWSSGFGEGGFHGGGGGGGSGRFNFAQVGGSMGYSNDGFGNYFDNATGNSVSWQTAVDGSVSRYGADIFKGVNSVGDANHLLGTTNYNSGSLYPVNNSLNKTGFQNFNGTMSYVLDGPIVNPKIITFAPLSASSGGDEFSGGVWSLSLNASWGGGFNMELGQVWDNKGGSKTYFTIGPTIGVDLSVGILQKNIRGKYFTVNKYRGFGSSFEASLGPVDWVITGGDNYEEHFYSKSGDWYTETGYGLSLSPFPAGIVWNFGKTHFLFD